MDDAFAFYVFQLISLREERKHAVSLTLCDTFVLYCNGPTTGTD